MLRTPRLLMLSLSLLLNVGAVGVGAPAAAAVSVGVTPSVVQLAATSGARSERELTISNEGDERFAATVAVAEMPGAPAPNSAVPWISVDLPTVDLEPGQTRDVTVDVEPPAGLASGGYYAVVTVTTEVRTVDDSGAAVAGQLEAPFLITVEGEGEVRTEAVVGRFAAVLETDGRTGFRAEVSNAGNTFLVLNGDIELAEADGTSLPRVELREPTLILPGVPTVLESRAPLLLEGGQEYRAMAEVDYGSRDPLLVATTFTANAPEIALRGIEVCDDGDEGPALAFEIENSGSLGILPTLTVTTRSLGASIPGGPIVVEAPVAWPDDVTGYALDDLGSLNDGSYEVSVSVTWGPTGSATRAIPFQVGGDGPGAVGACD